MLFSRINHQIRVITKLHTHLKLKVSNNALLLVEYSVLAELVEEYSIEESLSSVLAWLISTECSFGMKEKRNMGIGKTKEYCRNVDAKHRIGKSRNFEGMTLWIGHRKNVGILKEF